VIHAGCLSTLYGMLKWHHTNSPPPFLSAVSCAKMAELINLPFGLWTRVGRRKRKFHHIRQVASVCSRQCALMGREIGATWRTRLNSPSAAVMWPCQITLTTCNLLFLWPPCADADIISLPCDFFLSFFYSSPNLNGRKLDVYHTSTHGVALVRI